MCLLLRFEGGVFASMGGLTAVFPKRYIFCCTNKMCSQISCVMLHICILGWKVWLTIYSQGECFLILFSIWFINKFKNVLLKKMPEYEIMQVLNCCIINHARCHIIINNNYISIINPLLLACSRSTVETVWLKQQNYN